MKELNYQGEGRHLDQVRTEKYKLYGKTPTTILMYDKTLMSKINPEILGRKHK